MAGPPNPYYGKRAKTELAEVEGDLLDHFRGRAGRPRSSTDPRRCIDIAHDRLLDLAHNEMASHAVQLQALKTYLQYACGQPEMRVISTPGSTTNVAMIEAHLGPSELSEAERGLSEWRQRQIAAVSSFSALPPTAPTSSTPSG